MKRFIILLFVLIFYIFNKASGQSYINVQGSFNYWKHTEVFGPGIGFGYNYKIRKLNLAINYDFGYGTINRFKSIENINYDNWSTVFIIEQKGKWNEFLGKNEIPSEELNGNSDYGKQHQITIQVGYQLFKIKTIDLDFKSGLFGAIVEHFYTFDNIPIHYIELPSVYSGPLNYIPSTSQKIYAYGINFELTLNKIIKNKIISPYITVGLGPRFGSYLALGLRLSTVLLEK
jgi:hypothetical protein